MSSATSPITSGLREHPKVYLARIYTDLTEAPLPHIESGARDAGMQKVLAAARKYIDKLDQTAPRSRAKEKGPYGGQAV